MFDIQPIAEFFQRGGPFMWAILAVFAVALAIMVERFWVLYLSRKTGGRVQDATFMDRLVYLVRNGHGQESIRREGREGGLLTRVAARIIPHRREDRVQLRNAADEAVMIESSRITSRLSYLPMLANVAVLLGLLGTIFGLKEAFTGVGAASAVQQTELLSSGIAIALNTTAFGLMVAVPTLVAYAFLKGRAESILDAVDEFSLRIVNALIDTLPDDAAPGKDDMSEEERRQMVAGD